MAGWRDELTEPAGELFSRRETAETVSALTRRLKRLIERSGGAVRVTGEVSNFRRQASGHCYFQLKDEGAQLSCVMFRGDAMRQTVDLTDGMSAVLAGNLSLYEARGQYQLIVRSVEDEGIGKLQREFEALKKRLADEGVFDAEHKHPLPALPLRVAMVTSPTGAAVQDFCRILVRRGWRGRMVVVPVKVQGQGAAAEIADGIRWADASGAFDVIVTGRGGGSLEDLWAFNEEGVVRAIQAASTPVIAAVGHEIDFTLADFVADIRAETPSGAAELLSSAYQDQLTRIARVDERLSALMAQAMDTRRRELRGWRDRLRLLTPRAQLEQGWLRRDDLANRLEQALKRTMEDRRSRWELGQLSWRNVDPQSRFEQESSKLLSLSRRLQAVSPQATLRRGFTIVRDDAGKPIFRKTGTEVGLTYEVEFFDGRLRMKAQPDK